MSEELGAVLDAPEVDAIEPVEQAEPTEESVAIPSDPAAVPDSPEPDGDGRKLPQWIKDLKAVNPQAWKEAKGQFFGKLAIDDKLKDFDVDSVRSFLDEHGGQEGIASRLQEMQAKSGELDGINEAIATGNPELIREIAEAHPESFPKLAQATFQEWAQRDQEGWAHAMNGVIASTVFAENGVAQLFREMNLMLKYNDVEGLKGAVQSLNGWADQIRAGAQKPAQPTQAQGKPQANAAAHELAQLKQKAFDEGLNAEVKSFRAPLIEKGLTDYWGNATQAMKDLAAERVRADVVGRMAADTDFQKKLDGFYRSGDKDGAMRLIRSREAKVIEDVAPKVGRELFGSPAAKVAPKPPAVPVSRPVQPRKPAPVTDPRDSIFARIHSR